MNTSKVSFNSLVSEGETFKLESKEQNIGHQEINSLNAKQQLPTDNSKLYRRHSLHGQKSFPLLPVVLSCKITE